MRKYGMPYMGGKTKLAEKFVDIFPRATHFYDLFCGGCAVAHRAIVSGKYQHVHVNDLNPLMPKAFKMALNGEFDNERRWISREDFERLKNSDPYVAICFSFGNNLRNYLYNSNIEEMKKALHYAIFFLDFDLAHKYFGDRIDFITDIKDEYQRYLAAKKALSNKNTPPNTGAVSGELLQITINQEDAGNSSCSIHNNGNDFKEYRLQYLERKSRLQITPPQGVNVTFSDKTYQMVPILKDSVLYCDIPYEGTSEYVSNHEEFCYDDFYEWCNKQKEPLFISSYRMPEDLFIDIMAIKHTTSLSSISTSRTLEKLFIPVHQRDWLLPRLNNYQLSLF